MTMGVLLRSYVNCHLVECLRQPNIPSFQKFLPRESWKKPTEGDHVAMIKVTTFACGGIAIGVLVSHTIVDGISLIVFLKGWAAIARKACEEGVVCPNFGAPSIFIQNGAYSREAVMTALSRPCKSGRCIVRRIVFDASAIASLKTQATSSSMQNPTRVEVVSAFLWKCIMTAFKATSGIQGHFWYSKAYLYYPCSEFAPQSRPTIHGIFHGKYNLGNRCVMHG